MKLSSKIFVGAFILLISVPFFGRLALRGTTPHMVLETENRQVTAFSALKSWRRGEMRNWFRNNDAWISDRLAKKDFVVRLTNRVLANPQLFQSTDFSRGLFGQDGFLFLGNNFCRVLDRHFLPEFQIEKVNREKLLDRHTTLKRTAELQGASYALFVAPDKHSIFCEKLPSWMLGKNVCANVARVTLDLLDSFKKKNIPVVFPLQTLRAKNDQTIYFKPDTHWKPSGAQIGFQSLMESLTERGIRFNGKPFASTSPDTFSFEPYQLGTDGDLRIIIGVPRDFVIDDFGLKFHCNIPVVFSENGKPPVRLRAEEVSIRSATTKWFGHVRNESAPNKVRVLVFGDSFMVNMSSFFFTHFTDTHFYSFYGLETADMKAVIQEVKPDLVIYETVERSLF